LVKIANAKQRTSRKRAHRGWEINAQHSLVNWKWEGGGDLKITVIDQQRKKSRNNQTKLAWETNYGVGITAWERTR